MKTSSQTSPSPIHKLGKFCLLIERDKLFSGSPETNSQIRIDTWPLSAGQDGLAKVRQDLQPICVTIDPESITPNTTILGSPPFSTLPPQAGMAV
ncbi:MAG: SCO family protein [Chloroflexi bacterium]|nr:SCO family protein [Chloroflexota bacterium]